MEMTFSTIGISRLRMLNDGDGVTTLVAGYGCSLRCRYCLNPQCFAGQRTESVGAGESSERARPGESPECASEGQNTHGADMAQNSERAGAEQSRWKRYTVQELLDEVRIDDLYFQATGGGVVFGGGEPLLQADFIHAFRAAAPAEWKLGLESSLAVPEVMLQKVANDIDFFLIDIKDMNPQIYQAYTGRDNDLTRKNLEWLAEHVDPAKVCIRIPLIDGFNTDEDRQRSKEELEAMGFQRFDLFRYNTKIAEEKRSKVMGAGKD